MTKVIQYCGEEREANLKVISTTTRQYFISLGLEKLKPICTSILANFERFIYYFRAVKS